jgi:hypothetical protein
MQVAVWEKDSDTGDLEWRKRAEGEILGLGEEKANR